MAQSPQSQPHSAAPGRASEHASTETEASRLDEAGQPLTPLQPLALSVLLHRLRSPLTAVGGFAESIALQSRRGTLTEERLLDRLGRIRAAADRIDQLLDDLEATLKDEDAATR